MAISWLGDNRQITDNGKDIAKEKKRSKWEEGHLSWIINKGFVK